MKKINPVLHWLPRLLSLGFVLFLSLFSLDVFNEYQGWQTLLAFLIHSLPSLVVLVAVIIAWKYDLFGAIIFFGFAVAYVLMAGFDKPWSWYATISGPTLLISILFLANFMIKKMPDQFKNLK
ncbi:MAG: hypothetical protein HUU49_01910 [Candidatus Buchananbacteria bacterium]|nr:hypothetical protein [Candidatus Buchananbacteria bacterium]